MSQYKFLICMYYVTVLCNRLFTALSKIVSLEENNTNYILSPVSVSNPVKFFSERSFFIQLAVFFPKLHKCNSVLRVS